MTGNSNHKFKVGDKVIIRKRGDLTFWNNLMLERADGMVGEIVFIRSQDGYIAVKTNNELLQKLKDYWLYDVSNLEHYSTLPDELFTIEK